MSFPYDVTFRLEMFEPKPGDPNYYRDDCNDGYSDEDWDIYTQHVVEGKGLGLSSPDANVDYLDSIEEVNYA